MEHVLKPNNGQTYDLSNWNHYLSIQMSSTKFNDIFPNVWKRKAFPPSWGLRIYLLGPLALLKMLICDFRLEPKSHFERDYIISSRTTRAGQARHWSQVPNRRECQDFPAHTPVLIPVSGLDFPHWNL